MLVYEETANDLHREVSRIEKSRHFVYVRALITLCARLLRVKFCAVKMLNAKLRNHLHRDIGIEILEAWIPTTKQHSSRSKQTLNMYYHLGNTYSISLVIIFLSYQQCPERDLYYCQMKHLTYNNNKTDHRRATFFFLQEFSEYKVLLPVVLHIRNLHHKLDVSSALS